MNIININDIIGIGINISMNIKIIINMNINNCISININANSIGDERSDLKDNYAAAIRQLIR